MLALSETLLARYARAAPTAVAETRIVRVASAAAAAVLVHDLEELDNVAKQAQKCSRSDAVSAPAPAD
jgi:hypothetical protein